MPATNTTAAVQEVRTTDDFEAIVTQAQSILGRLKPLDYDALYEELASLNVRTSESPHLQQLNSDLQVVQSAKDRVSEISVEAMRHYQTTRRVADLLTEGWIKFSDQSGADKRKGEAQLKMSQFEYIAVEAETLHKASLAVLKNLDSKHEASSRQITCFSLQLKLRDVGRTVGDSNFLPEDFTDYTKPAAAPTSPPIAPVAIAPARADAPFGAAAASEPVIAQPAPSAPPAPLTQTPLPPVVYTNPPTPPNALSTATTISASRTPSWEDFLKA